MIGKAGQLWYPSGETHICINSAWGWAYTLTALITARRVELQWLKTHTPVSHSRPFKALYPGLWHQFFPGSHFTEASGENSIQNKEKNWQCWPTLSVFQCQVRAWRDGYFQPVGHIKFSKCLFWVAEWVGLKILTVQHAFLGNFRYSFNTTD